MDRVLPNKIGLSADLCVTFVAMDSEAKYNWLICRPVCVTFVAMDREAK